jgi:hypothetical protein
VTAVLRLVEVIQEVSPRSLDAAAQPCRDCEVGEPHMCPRLKSVVVLAPIDEVTG